MARRNQGNKPADQSEPTATVDETVEPTTDETVSEETTDETPTDETDAKAPAKPIDLEPFKAAVTEALTTRDQATGELPEESLEAVNAEYRALDGVKAKNQARKWIEEQMLTLIKESKFQEARGFVDVKDNLSAGAGGGGPRTPADPTAAHVQRMASFYLAINYLTQNVGEDVSGDWAEQVDAMVTAETPNLESYVAYQKSDDEDAEEPEVAPVVRQAYKLTAGKAAGGSGRVSSGGPRRDVAKHIEQVFADEEEGTFLTVNEIAKRKSTEYGDDPISAGAISARLFPKGKEPYADNGIAASHPEGKPRGAVKTAA